MVGRMGGQSVVIRAEKGKVRMLLDGDHASSDKELVYDARKDIDNDYDQDTSSGLRPAAEDHRGALALERTPDERAVVSGDGDQPGALGSVAASGDRGDAAGAGSQQAGSAAAGEPAPLAADREKALRFEGQTGETSTGNPEDQGGDDNPIVRDGGDGRSLERSADGASSGRGDHEGALRADECLAGGRAAGGLAQDLLQVGRAGALRAALESGGSVRGSSFSAGGPGEAESGTGARPGSPGECGLAAQDGVEGCADGLEADARHGPGGKKMSASGGWWP